MSIIVAVTSCLAGTGVYGGCVQRWEKTAAEL